jgi:putative transposase
MKKSRFSDEQIVKILSSITDGFTVREVCQSHGVSENTFYTWKRKYAGMESDVIRKLKDLQSENQALKQIVADQALLIEASKKLLRKNWLKASDIRLGVRFLMSNGVSKRKAYQFVGITWHGLDLPLKVKMTA